jgi:hypothetical protein
MLSKELIAAKRQELCQIVDQLLEHVSEGVEQQMPIHEVESQTFRTLLAAGRTTLQLLIDLQGDGDVGEEHQLPDGKTLHRSQEPHTRPYVSIFGELQIKRYVYAQREGQKIEFASVDARLALPESKFSYVLQDWDQDFAMEQPFGNVKRTVEKILGLDQHVDSLERMNRDMAQHVEGYHAAQSAPPPEEEGQIFVQTADGKGVPIRRPADTPPIHDHQHQRGPKPDRKKMATIGAVYSVDPFVRTPEEVVEALFHDPQKQEQNEGAQRKRPRPCHKRMRAMLNWVDEEGNEIDGRPAIFGWISEEMASRQAGTDRPIVNIMDGEPSLWNMRDVFQANVSLVDILDLLHVTPRLWDAAALFHSRESRAAEKFVRERVLRILRGDVQGVIRGLRRMGTQQLSGKKRSALETICRYFEKNRQRMRYNEYLAAGYPIASGVIEGACRHIVKDRMERTGMNWVVAGAQAMLDLRCIFLCDAWNEYVAYRIAQETEHLYPYRDSLQPISCSLAA